jgi:hypothetical protein
MLHYDPAVAERLGGIPWKALNRRFRNDYARTLAEVERTIVERGGDPTAVTAGCAAVLDELRVFAPLRGARHRPPRG